MEALLYTLFILLIAWIIIKFGDKLLMKMSFFGKKISNLKSYADFIPSRQAKALLNFLDSNFDGKQSCMITPQYSFYTDLINYLFEVRFKLGSPIREILRSLKVQLLREVKLLKSIEEHIISSYIQFLMISLICLSLLLSIENLLVLKFDWSLFIPVIIWQFLGFAIYTKLIQFQVRSVSKGQSDLKHGFYRFQSLRTLPLSGQLKVGRSMKIIEKIKVSGAVFRFRSLLESYSLNGELDIKELALIEDEITYCDEELVETVKRRVQLCRTLVLILFFFASYLGCLITIFGQISIAEF